MTKKPPPSDLIWKALADSTRREILDALALRPHTTGEIAKRFEDHCRTNIMKHLEILVAANLVVVRREGRVRWNYLNPVPIERVCNRWVGKHVKRLASSLSRLKDHVEVRESSRSAKRRTTSKRSPKSKRTRK